MGRLISTILGMLMLATVGLGQDEIRLRRAARVPPAKPVLLEHVALLSGPAAEDLAEVVVLDGTERTRSSGGWIELSVQDVRAAIDRERKVNWGAVAISGSVCSVRIASVGPTTPTTPDSVSREEPAPLDLSGPQTVRTATVRRLQDVLRVPIEDLRIGFEDRDAELLAMPLSGRIVETRPLGLAERVPVAVHVYEGERVVAKGTIRAAVRVRRDVAIARTGKRRGEVLGAEDVSIERLWLAPDTEPAPPEKIVGAAARTRIAAGQVIGRTDVEPPLAVRRGELVRVHCMAGSIVVQMTARAQRDGRDGEVIELRIPDSDHTFFARLDGPGRAVKVANLTPPDADEDRPDPGARAKEHP